MGLVLVAIALILSLEEHPQAPALQVVQAVLLAEHFTTDFLILLGIQVFNFNYLVCNV